MRAMFTPLHPFLVKNNRVCFYLHPIPRLLVALIYRCINILGCKGNKKTNKQIKKHKKYGFNFKNDLAYRPK